MILKSFETDKIQKIKSSIILIYGENEGLKYQIIKNSIANNFKGTLEKYEEKEILNNKDNFFSNVLNKSFFSEKKIIIINRISEKIIDIIESLEDKDISDAKIILVSGSLDKRSKLRNLFEKSKNLIIIAVYPDELKTLFTIASNFFKDKKKSISNETINIIIDKSNGDRQNLLNELNKIMMFVGENDKVNQKDVEKLVNLSENYSVGELVDNCLAKNLKKTIKILNENKFGSDDCILILRTLLAKSKRVLDLRESYEEIKNLDKILSSYKPPIFWKDKDLVKNQVINWELKNVKKLVYKITEIEIMLKKNSINSLNILYDFLINTSKSSNN